MSTDLHASIRQIIDRSLAGAASAEEQQALREHLPTCAACSRYLETSNRAIATLGDFSFPIDPALDTKVLAALAARAQQLEAQHARRRSMALAGLLALTLTALGSLAVFLLSGLAAPALHLDPIQLRFGLAAFWIAPSIFICLLLLLPGFQAGLGSRKGLSV